MFGLKCQGKVAWHVFFTRGISMLIAAVSFTALLHVRACVFACRFFRTGFGKKDATNNGGRFAAAVCIDIPYFSSNPPRLLV